MVSQLHTAWHLYFWPQLSVTLHPWFNCASLTLLHRLSALGAFFTLFALLKRSFVQSELTSWVFLGSGYSQLQPTESINPWISELCALTYSNPGYGFTPNRSPPTHGLVGHLAMGWWTLLDVTDHIQVKVRLVHTTHWPMGWQTSVIWDWRGPQGTCDTSTQIP